MSSPRQRRKRLNVDPQTLIQFVGYFNVDYPVQNEITVPEEQTDYLKDRLRRRRAKRNLLEEGLQPPPQQQDEPGLDDQPMRDRNPEAVERRRLDFEGASEFVQQTQTVVENMRARSQIPL